MPEFSTHGKIGPVKWAFAGLGGGAGATVAVFGIKALMERPEFLPQLLSSGFLGFAALMVGMVMFRKEFASFNAMQERNVIAQEQLARNVGTLVEKDDTRAQALEAAMRYVAEDTRQILSLLKAKAPEGLDGR